MQTYANKNDATVRFEVEDSSGSSAEGWVNMYRLDPDGERIGAPLEMDAETLAAIYEIYESHEGHEGEAEEG